jgi:MFS superfamily sulfate permease-like transporter
LFGVLTVGILQGIFVAVTLSLINLILRISRPHDAVLDDVETGGGVVYKDVGDTTTGQAEPGLLVYRFDAPLIFANSAYFTQRLDALVAGVGKELKCVILDAEAISDFDTTAAEALENLDTDLERRGVELWIARANGPLRELLRATGLEEKIGAANIYPSIRAAVEAYRARFGG